MGYLIFITQDKPTARGCEHENTSAGTGTREIDLNKNERSKEVNSDRFSGYTLFFFVKLFGVRLNKNNNEFSSYFFKEDISRTRS